MKKDVGEKRRIIRTNWNADCLIMSSSEYVFFESDFSFTKYVSSCPKTKYLYLRFTSFENDNTGESVFQFL